MHYKVIKGEVGGNGGKKYNIGDEVKSSDFPQGNAETLVEMGFLEVVETESDGNEGGGDGNEGGGDGNEGGGDDDDITKAEIIAELHSLEIEFNPRSNKAELLAILKAAKVDRGNDNI